MADIEVDVLVVGAGPIGLNLAYQLRHFSSVPIADPLTTNPISVHIIEALPKPTQEAFGRAVTFWPRSMEMLSQLGLGHPIMQDCFAVRSSAAYDTEGREVFGRGWSFLEGINDTRYKFATVLRQKYVEDIFRAKLKRLGVEVAEHNKFLSLEVMEDVPIGEKGRIRAQVLDSSRGEGKQRQYTVSCRYLIGCDGTKTVVRGAAGIESVGSRTEDKWVRVDGLLKSTTMPKPRSYGSLESPVYGNVLWIPLDHGTTRIGFAMNEERRKLYDEVDREAFIKEAMLSVAPFKAEFERVDWASVYSVGQRLAQRFWAQGSIFIAGDAAHSHSSGAGQGMNTGVHDAVNLGWKLAMVLNGALKPEVLETYDLERRPNASKLIKYDEDISILISGRLPPGWTGNKDPNAALGDIFEEATGFNTGLTIGYEPNMAIWRNDELKTDHNAEYKARSTIPAPAIPGYRAPDVQLLLPALWQPVWLHELTPNVAKFYVMVFAGNSQDSREKFQTLRSTIVSSERFVIENTVTRDGTLDPNPRPWPVDFLTILPHRSDSVWTELGTNPLGNAYYDTDDGNFGRRYGVDSRAGSVFILRPDGFIGAIFPLSCQGAEEIIVFFNRLLY
jgi:phenol 2-monooxygenase (NADPH)